MDEGGVTRVYMGEARIGEVLKGMDKLSFRPEDFRSPVAFQMAMSRVMDAVMKMMSEGMRKTYVAEIRFKDDMGNPVVMAVDLGEALPPFSDRKVKARIIVELYEETGSGEKQ